MKFTHEPENQWLQPKMAAWHWCGVTNLQPWLISLLSTGMIRVGIFGVVRNYVFFVGEAGRKTQPGWISWEQPVTFPDSLLFQSPSVLDGAGQCLTALHCIQSLLKCDLGQVTAFPSFSVHLCKMKKRKRLLHHRPVEELVKFDT